MVIFSFIYTLFWKYICRWTLFGQIPKLLLQFFKLSVGSRLRRPSGCFKEVQMHHSHFVFILDVVTSPHTVRDPFTKTVKYIQFSRWLSSDVMMFVRNISLILHCHLGSSSSTSFHTNHHWKILCFFSHFPTSPMLLQPLSTLSLNSTICCGVALGFLDWSFLGFFV